jgi:hypothetical protein
VTRDITEGRATRAIAVDLGIATTNTWQNTGDSYDCAIAGIPFLTAISDERLYQRATSPFRKQQFDSQRDPGEQSLSTWWLRSQSSFHAGEGILFYDPLANPYSTTIASNSYRIKESYSHDRHNIYDLRDPNLNRPRIVEGSARSSSFVPSNQEKVHHHQNRFQICKMRAMKRELQR